MSKFVPALGIRGTAGISLSYGPPQNEVVNAFEKDLSKRCSCMKWSPLGDFFAWVNGSCVTVVRTSDWSVATKVDKPQVSAIDFSPKGTYFSIFQPYKTAKDPAQSFLNVEIYQTSSGTLLYSFEQKKPTEWEPLWSGDESYFSRLYKNDVLFYNSASPDQVEHKFVNKRVHKYSLSPSISESFHVLCYIPGNQKLPSTGKLFQFPNFDTPIATKTFFQADRVYMFWNKKGTGVLLQTSLDVDKTGSSYYGKQTLHFLSIKGDTSIVQLGKEGSIHSVAWSPLSTEFTVIYGLMPAKATIFNLKCEPVFELGVGPRNSIYYNPHGNVLLLGGFGNLQGYIELWDVNNRKCYAKAKAPDTTLLEWSPQGTHFLTATTAPRLKVCNGYKIWHSSGSLVFDRPWNQQEELWEVSWQKCRDGTFPTPGISYTPIQGIALSTSQASKEVYRPPSARGTPSRFKLNEGLDSSAPIAQQSKAALKQQKKRKAKQAAKAASTITEGEEDQSTRPKNVSAHADITSDDPEKNKKIGRIKTKLGDIERLKDQLKAGKQLEANQIEKIKKETSLIEELMSLAV